MPRVRHDLWFPAASVPVTTGVRAGGNSMKRKRSGNWDLLYGFLFLVLFIFIHTIFISHETDTFKTDSANHTINPNVIRAKKFQQSRKDLIDAVAKMKEPHPKNHKEAKALAVNTIYRMKQRKALQWLVPWPEEAGDVETRVAFFRNACMEKGLNGTDLDDCTYTNEMSARRTSIAKHCEHLKADSKSSKKILPMVESKKIFVLRYRKLVYCPVYKAASTNWITNLPNLSNFRPSQIKILKRRFLQANELAQVVAKPLPLAQFRRYVATNDPVKFMIVRHPFERLLSAYRDKFERLNEHFHSMYGQEIVKKYRQQGIRKFGESFYDRNGSHNGCPIDREFCDRDEGSTPTFWEFTRAILDGAVGLDDHWSPAHISCSLCTLSYDMVLHFEYLSQEQAYLLRQLGLDHTVANNQWQHKNLRPITPDQKSKYFQMLDPSEINTLYNYYKVDFDLFDYDLNSYLHN